MLEADRHFSTLSKSRRFTQFLCPNLSEKFFRVRNCRKKRGRIDTRGKRDSPLSFNPSGEEKRSLGGHSLMNRKRRVVTGHGSGEITHSHGEERTVVRRCCRWSRI